ncbi:MAG: hypothetical protein JXA93_22935 [Anaerolineae bacterium]|nr:hypothetical protein [Anaerolineae bacterium]
MVKKNGRPRWWQTWVAVVLFGLGCLWIARAPLSAIGHEGADLAAIAVLYGLLFLWLRANRGAWLSETYDERSRQAIGRTDDPATREDRRFTD